MKNYKNGSLLFAVIILLVVAFFIGRQTVPPTVSDDSGYAQSLDTLRSERDKANNELESACSNYRTLYASYDALYQKTGSGTGLEKVVRANNARGDDDTCYR